mmetsp:Transcript_12432/g.23876  ORF Transcript_12432/g.23876 Transcript_12432/m.23876 type:complete len:218 (+) Transcript_12432:1236-1889(+)
MLQAYRRILLGLFGVPTHKEGTVLFEQAKHLLGRAAPVAWDLQQSHPGLHSLHVPRELVLLCLARSTDFGQDSSLACLTLCCVVAGRSSSGICSSSGSPPGKLLLVLLFSSSGSGAALSFLSSENGLQVQFLLLLHHRQRGSQPIELCFIEIAVPFFARRRTPITLQVIQQSVRVSCVIVCKLLLLLCLLCLLDSVLHVAPGGGRGHMDRCDGFGRG